HGYAVGVVRAAVKNFVIGDQAHHFAACAESAERQSAADRFGKTDHVRLHAKIIAGSAPGEFCASFHFVENQQSAVGIAKSPQAFQKTWLRNTKSHVHQDRFEDDRCDLAGILEGL